MIKFNQKNWIKNLIKTKIDENAKLCYMDTDSFIVHLKAEDIYKDIAEDVETRFGTSNFEIDKPLPVGKKNDWVNERWIRWTNHETFVRLRAKTYSHLKDNGEDEKGKGTKKFHIKKTYI